MSPVVLQLHTYNRELERCRVENMHHKGESWEWSCEADRHKIM